VQGPQPLEAEFAGDGYYLPSEDTGKSAIVFAFPSRGIFLLGDKTVGAAPSSVAFWGAQWTALNVLTGAESKALAGVGLRPGARGSSG
jgi:hypothetical protein